MAPRKDSIKFHEKETCEAPHAKSFAMRPRSVSLRPLPLNTLVNSRDHAHRDKTIADGRNRIFARAKLFSGYKFFRRTARQSRDGKPATGNLAPIPEAKFELISREFLERFEGRFAKLIDL